MLAPSGEGFRKQALVCIVVDTSREMRARRKDIIGFDLVQSFDLVRIFDLVQSFDLVWSFDLVRSFNLVWSFDLPMRASVAQDIHLIIADIVRDLWKVNIMEYWWYVHRLVLITSQDGLVFGQNIMWTGYECWAESEYMFSDGSVVCAASVDRYRTTHIIDIHLIIADIVQDLWKANIMEYLWYVHRLVLITSQDGLVFGQKIIGLDKVAGSDTYKHFFVLVTLEVNKLLKALSTSSSLFDKLLVLSMPSNSLGMSEIANLAILYSWGSLGGVEEMDYP
ncbi:hypothetical protein Tco_0617911, partial [Tanacetum coccineum]